MENIARCGIKLQRSHGRFVTPSSKVQEENCSDDETLDSHHKVSARQGASQQGSQPRYDSMQSSFWNRSQEKRDEISRLYKEMKLRQSLLEHSTAKLDSGKKHTPRKALTPFNFIQRIEREEEQDEVQRMFREVRKRRRSVLESSTSKGNTGKKPPASKALTPLNLCRQFGQGGLLLSRTRLQSRRLQEAAEAEWRGNVGTNTDAAADKLNGGVSSQECCRALQFESGDEAEAEDDDHTTPLQVMDVKSIMSDASVLCSRLSQKQKQTEPQIKKHLIHVPDIRLRKTSAPYSLRNPRDNQLEKESCQKDVSTTNSEIADGGSQAKGTLLNHNNNCQTVNHAQQDKNQETEEADSSSTAVECSKTVRFTNVHIAQRRPARRRSAIATRSVTPHKYTGTSKGRSVRSTSKLPRFNAAHPVTSQPLQRRRSGHLRQQQHSTEPQNTKVHIPSVTKANDSEPQEEKKDHAGAVGGATEKCDAATNTTIRFARQVSPNKPHLIGLDDLAVQQEEIDQQVDLVRKRTLERRQQMKDLRLVEGFATSVSPLKRIKLLLEKRDLLSTSSSYVPEADREDVNKSEESFLLMEASVLHPGTSSGAFNTTDGCITADTSVQESSMLNVTSNLNTSQSQWNHLKHENRFLKTPSAASSKKYQSRLSHHTEHNEISDAGEKGDKSPFTDLVGNCERPSLAPMTPHSRRQVSLLKLSLKKQLEELYD